MGALETPSDTLVFTNWGNTCSRLDGVVEIFLTLKWADLALAT